MTENTSGKFKMYTLDELMPILEVSKRTMMNYIKAGKLKGVKIGGRWKVSEENVQKFLNGET